MNTTPSQDIPILRFCLLWVLATTIAATAALLLADFLVWLLIRNTTEEVAFANDNAVGPILAFAFWMIVLLGPLVGYVQALVLRHVAHFPAWDRWWLASSLLIPIYLSVAFGIWVFLTLGAGSAECMTIGLIVLPGLAVGLATSPLLPMLDIRPPSRWIWVMVNIIAVPLGFACGFLITSTTGASYFAVPAWNFPFYPLQSAMYWALGWVVGTIVFSALTGVVLAWLLRRQGSSFDVTKVT